MQDQLPNFIGKYLRTYSSQINGQMMGKEVYLTGRND